MANVAQGEYWNAGAGEAWVRQQDRMDIQLAPLGEATMAALGVTRGDRVLDVGCGAGTTTATLARLGARPTGTDISEALISRARERYADCEFVVADAQTHAFAAFAAVYSRFGVMFFDDPAAAFTNLARAVAPRGRLAFVCWRSLKDNPLFTAPMAAAIDAGIPAPAPTDPDAPGPFAFADRDRVARILTGAGWHDIAIEPHQIMIGGNSLADSVELALQIGPLGRMLREHPDARDRAVDAIRDQLGRHVVDGNVMMTSATWIVTART
jgi:SAM-dependent methyltransferase